MSNWGLQFTMWLPEDMKPVKSTESMGWGYKWDPRMLATVAILAKAIPGQGHFVKDILCTIVEARVPTEQNLLDTTTRIYERAGLIALQVCSSSIL
jgi:hypothetical protein